LIFFKGNLDRIITGLVADEVILFISILS
jgi:hypothetical protein